MIKTHDSEPSRFNRFATALAAAGIAVSALLLNNASDVKADPIRNNTASAQGEYNPEVKVFTEMQGKIELLINSANAEISSRTFDNGNERLVSRTDTMIIERVIKGGSISYSLEKIDAKKDVTYFLKYILNPALKSEIATGGIVDLDGVNPDAGFTSIDGGDLSPKEVKNQTALYDAINLR